MQMHLVSPVADIANIRGKENSDETVLFARRLLAFAPYRASARPVCPTIWSRSTCEAKKLENGDDYLKVNPKGQVPALALDNGELVTEGPVIVQMIADKAAGKNLAPARDSAERYKLLEWLNFISTELHKNFGPMFSPVLADDAKAFFKDRVMGKFKYLDGELAGHDYLMGKQFTVADGYLFTMLSWADRMKFDLSACRT